MMLYRDIEKGIGQATPNCVTYVIAQMCNV